MNVGVYVSENVPELGGGFTFEEDLVRSFINIGREMDHSLVFFSKNNSLCRPGHDSSENQKFVTIPDQSFLGRQVNRLSRFFNSILPSYIQVKNSPSEFEKLVSENKIDIIIFCTPFHDPIDIPYITVVWDLQHRLQPWFPEVSSSGIWQKREKIHMATIQRASFVIAGTEAGREEISLFYSVPKERILILPHPTPRFSIGAATTTVTSHLRKKFGISKEYLIYPAQFWPHKNHVNLLFAMKILKERFHIPLSLILVGSDKGNLDYIKKIINESDLTGDVLFPGFVSRKDLTILYQNAFALVYPTFFGPENLPPLEAFSLRCPVIASNVAGSHEQFGDAAVFFNPKNPEEIAMAVENLYRNPSKREELIQRGYTRANQWTGDDFVRALKPVLNEFEKVRHCWE
jgi:glycosyltransferase involved in cell wall biosynthesis